MSADSTHSTQKCKPEPVLRTGELWILRDALRALGVNARTLARWKKRGFKPLQPGTARKYVTSEQIIQIMQQEDIPAEYEPEYKQKPNRRKKE